MSGHRHQQQGHHDHHDQSDGMTYTGIFYRREDDPSGKNGASGPPPVGAVIVEEVQSPAMRSGQPMAMVCPHCRRHMETEVIYETGMGAWLVAGLICLSGCCCFAWIPLVTNVMKDAIHNCSECHREVGRYIRIQPHQQQRRRRRNTTRRPAREQQPTRDASQKSTLSWRNGSRSSQQSPRKDSKSSSGGGFFNFGGGGEKSNNRNDSKDSGGGIFSWGDKGRSQSERRGDGKRDLTDKERRQRSQGGGQQRGSFSLW